MNTGLNNDSVPKVRIKYIIIINFIGTNKSKI